MRHLFSDFPGSWHKILYPCELLLGFIWPDEDCELKCIGAKPIYAFLQSSVPWCFLIDLLVAKQSTKPCFCFFFCFLIKGQLFLHLLFRNIVEHLTTKIGGDHDKKGNQGRHLSRDKNLITNIYIFFPYLLNWYPSFQLNYHVSIYLYHYRKGQDINWKYCCLLEVVKISLKLVYVHQKCLYLSFDKNLFTKSLSLRSMFLILFLILRLRWLFTEALHKLEWINFSHPIAPNPIASFIMSVDIDTIYSDYTC